TLDTTPVNDAPAVTSSVVTAATEDAAYSYTITTSDVDGDALTITAPTLPAWLTLIDNGDGTATLSGTPTNAEVGGHSVALEVFDSAGSDTQNFTINVSGATIDPDAVFELTDTDNGQDPAVEVPTYEDPAADSAADSAPEPVVESAQAPPVEKLSTPQDLADADDQLVNMQDPATEEAQEIILLTDEINTDSQPEGRDDDRADIYFDNDLYKDMRLSKYLDVNYKAVENAPLASSGDDFSLLDFNSDDPGVVDVNSDYDLLREEIDESFDTELKSQSVKAKIVTVTTASFTVGIVSYLLRAGSLVASLMSSLPLWRGFDPIAIFSGEKRKKKGRRTRPDADELKAETFFDGEAK
ncbi:MAG: putative Ig domain-containing protein, partial [Planctomycetota bacterium]